MQLRCILVLIRAGNKAVLLEEEGNRERKRGREGGSGWEGRKRGREKKWEILNFNNTGTIL